MKEAKQKSAQPRRRRTSKVWEEGGGMLTFGLLENTIISGLNVAGVKITRLIFQKSEQHHTPVVARPRSLVLQKVDQDNNNNHRWCL